MRVAFVTVGDTGRLTGGYLYNDRVLTALRERGVAVEEIVPCGVSPEEQETAPADASAVAGVAGLKPEGGAPFDGNCHCVCRSKPS